MSNSKACGGRENGSGGGSGVDSSSSHAILTLSHLHLLVEFLVSKRILDFLAARAKPLLQESSRKVKDVSMPSLDVGVARSFPARPFIPPVAAKDVALEGTEGLRRLNVIQRNVRLIRIHAGTNKLSAPKGKGGRKGGFGEKGWSRELEGGSSTHNKHRELT